MNISNLTGLFLIVLPIAFNIVFFLLQRNFEYPDILRKPTDYILSRFNKGGNGLIMTWYAFAITGVLFIPIAFLVHQTLASDTTPYMPLATIIGVLAGMVQCLGLIRWPFVVPYLARTYFEPNSTQATKDSISVVFQAFHRYAGVAMGEHLGYLFTSLWTAFIALAVTQSSLFSPWLGWIGLVPAIGIFIGLFEESGFKAAGAITAISYILWSLWLIALGVILVLN
ncbi:MAG TPA: DUF4386 domain-containing protein [Anaerolineales bacterium]|nr:DUF4386 domain-containing protein [Anaerolineales bacterium]